MNAGSTDNESNRKKIRSTTSPEFKEIFKVDSAELFNSAGEHVQNTSCSDAGNGSSPAPLDMAHIFLSTTSPNNAVGSGTNFSDNSPENSGYISSVSDSSLSSSNYGSVVHDPTPMSDGSPPPGNTQDNQEINTATKTPPNTPVTTPRSLINGIGVLLEGQGKFGKKHKHRSVEEKGNVTTNSPGI